MSIAANITNSLKSLTWKQTEVGLKKGITVLGSFGQFRHIRSALIGYKEQKFFVSFLQFASVMSHSTMIDDNLKAMEKAQIPKKFYPLLYGAIPALHLLSEHLERPIQEKDLLELKIKRLIHLRDQKRVEFVDQNDQAVANGAPIGDRIEKLKEKQQELVKSHHAKLQALVDFFYLHATDIATLANVVTTISAIYLGVGVAENSFQLAFLLLGFLEQGNFLIKPCQNEGILFKIGDGVVVRFYDPLLKKVTGLVSIPYQYLTQKTFGKFMAILSLIFVAPEFLINKLKLLGNIAYQRSETVRKAVDDIQKTYSLKRKLAQQESKGISVDLMQAPYPIPDYKSGEAKWTEKALQPLQFLDHYSEQTLESLQGEFNTKVTALKDDPFEVEPQKQPKVQMQELADHLSKFLKGIKHKQSKKEMAAIVKSVYGLILQDFDKRYQILLKRKDSLLCEPATARELKGAYLELIVMKQNQIGRQTPVESIRSELEGAFLISMQEIRDRIFQNIVATHLMESFSRLLEHQIAAKEIKEKSIDANLKIIKRITHWVHGVLYLLGVQVMINALNILMTNTHGFSMQAVYWGRNLGLSNQTNAEADVEEHLKSNPVRKKQVALMMTPMRAMFEGQFNQHYFEGIENEVNQKKENVEWELVTIIANPFDERIRWSVVQNYLFNSLSEDDSNGKSEQQLFLEEVTNLGVQPNARDQKYGGTENGKISSIEGEQSYQQDTLAWQKRLQTIVEKYLPKLLHETGIKVVVN